MRSSRKYYLYLSIFYGDGLCLNNYFRGLVGSLVGLIWTQPPSESSTTSAGMAELDFTEL